MAFRAFRCRLTQELRLALPSPREIARRIELAKPDAIHIATEGPVGQMVRAYCQRRARAFTTSYTTRFPEYISARAPISESWIYAGLRWFHAAATVTMVATPSLMSELARRGFSNLGMWTRGVDTDLFRPDRAIELGFRRPIFICVGRVAVEKNLDAFLSLDLPGTKVVVGAGPQEDELKRRYPDAKFLGLLENGTLAGASRRRRRIRVPKPDGYVRRRATRGAGERRSGRRLPGDRPEGCRGRQADWGLERRLARGLPRGPRMFRGRNAAPSR